MGKGKNSFFYNPQFRLSVYIFAYLYIVCFKVLTLFNSKFEKILQRYEDGDSVAAGIISFTSGLIFTILFTLLAKHKIEWTVKAMLMVPSVYIISGALGWLSLSKYYYYENEEEN